MLLCEQSFLTRNWYSWGKYKSCGLQAHWLIISNTSLGTRKRKIDWPLASYLSVARFQRDGNQRKEIFELATKEQVRISLILSTSPQRVPVAPQSHRCSGLCYVPFKSKTMISSENGNEKPEIGRRPRSGFDPSTSKKEIKDKERNPPPPQLARFQ